MRIRRLAGTVGAVALAVTLVLVGLGRLDPAAAIAGAGAYLADAGVSSAGIVGTSEASTAEGEFEALGAIAADGVGGFFVYDRGADEIQRWVLKSGSKRTWTLKKQWGLTSSGYERSNGLAASSAHVFWVDTQGDRVYRFGFDGAEESVWGAHGSADGQLDTPRDVSEASDGSLLVADSENGRIARFDADGTWLGSFAISSSGYPLAVSASKTGDIFVTDGRSSEIQHYEADGTFVNSWAVRSSAYGGIAADKYGRVYYCDVSNDSIQKFSPEGELIAEFGGTGSGTGEFDSPVDVSVDGLSRLFVSDFGNDRVQVFRSIKHGLSRATLSSSNADKGETVVVSGTLKPAHETGSKVRVIAQRRNAHGDKVGAARVYAAHVTSSTSSSSKWSVRVSMSTRGRWYFTASVAADDLHSAGKSAHASKRLTVK